MLPTTIDGVVERLEEIIRRSVADHDRRGYFAALYNRVTLRVREGVRRGEFEDNARMERLDVIFANRYLAAYDGYARGERPTKPWQRAFEAAGRDGLFVIQHLLLGMTAHIMLDLGIAASEVAREGGLAALRRDYLHINDLLAAEVDTVEDQLVAIAGRWQPGLGAMLDLVDRMAHRADESAASFLIDASRDRAWDFAVSLVDAPANTRPTVIDLHETATTLLSDAVMIDAPLVSLIAGGSHRDVAENIRILARGEMAL
ncbi:Hypothetical protein A7982_11980 [Minicystis rosea]|nr:Hypothetical protein A7982_11980 [Minicystis rosea]